MKRDTFVQEHHTEEILLRYVVAADEYQHWHGVLERLLKKAKTKHFGPIGWVILGRDLAEARRKKESWSMVYNDARADVWGYGRRRMAEVAPLWKPGDADQLIQTWEADEALPK